MVKIDSQGKSTVIQSFTSSGGHFEIISKNDFEIPVGDKSVKASDIIRNMCMDASLYPDEGKSVIVDEAFVAGMI